MWSTTDSDFSEWVARKMIIPISIGRSHFPLIKFPLIGWNHELPHALPWDCETAHILMHKYPNFDVRCRNLTQLLRNSTKLPCSRGRFTMSGSSLQVEYNFDTVRWSWNRRKKGWGHISYDTPNLRKHESWFMLQWCFFSYDGQETKWMLSKGESKYTLRGNHSFLRILYRLRAGLWAITDV